MSDIERKPIHNTGMPIPDNWVANVQFHDTVTALEK
jgi:hypothetical protein